MIPETKQPAVQRALQQTFQVDRWSSIEPLTRGLSSAHIYRMVVGDTPYLLRVIMRDDAIADPTRQLACMRAAAAGGIAPQVLYESVENRVLITNFIAASPFPGDMAARMADSLRALHKLPPFPKIFTYLDVMDGVVKRFEASQLVPHEVMAEFSGNYARMVAAYPRFEWDQVSCHNDLKPDNVLFDGSRMWLVDWEAAFLNDRYTELAVVANFYGDEAEGAEEAYLETYFGEPAGRLRLSQFLVMRQYMSAIYAAFFLTSAARLGARIDAGIELPDFREYNQRLVRFEIHLLDPQHQAEYGLLHLRHALRQMRSARFAEAIAELQAHV